MRYQVWDEEDGREWTESTIEADTFEDAAEQYTIQKDNGDYSISEIDLVVENQNGEQKRFNVASAPVLNYEVTEK